MLKRAVGDVVRVSRNGHVLRPKPNEQAAVYAEPTQQYLKREVDATSVARTRDKTASEVVKTDVLQGIRLFDCQKLCEGMCKAFTEHSNHVRSTRKTPH